MASKTDDPYTFLMRQNKLPMSLLTDSVKVIFRYIFCFFGLVNTHFIYLQTARMHLLDVDPFQNTFGPKAQRKKPKITAISMDDLVSKSISSQGNCLFSCINSSHFTFPFPLYQTNSLIFLLEKDNYVADKDGSLLANVSQTGASDEARDPVFSKGQSKRIWSELYKVIDSSDVIIHVLDARDPMGTRCKNVENHLKKEAKHKHLIFVLNKCDLVPTWVTVSYRDDFLFFSSFPV